ncbi:MAG: hypothetical protein HLX50_03630 [Alteromonadaceae bacterium]|nr:hypothetical protein [Alteromonadaceae bacterium]
MAFEYGTQKLNIRNPFRFEGLIRSVGWVILTAMGVYLLLHKRPVRTTEKAKSKMSLAR